MLTSVSLPINVVVLPAVMQILDLDFIFIMFWFLWGLGHVLEPHQM